MSKILLQGLFLYRCKDCKCNKVMHLQEGVEGENKIMPCPHTIKCPECGGLLSHIFGLDIFFPRLEEIEEGTDYFKLNIECGHATPVFDYKKE